MMDKIMPNMRGNDMGSRKKKIPATAMMAPPPARIIGTAESGPPFWKSKKKNTVPTPTQMPVSTQ